ncbi:hypothetical protein F5148DRAFT_1283086 [Russula earlei]|uniref:Uncharacterized protein n=1 Tax=Russula earlei TaxID=71964 RepID=A0ACC0UC51_9AGAM|nr:hypothetical protein F5148DRAFT_1283086 [Russula earlei]
MPSLATVYFVAAIAGATCFGAYVILTFAALYLLFQRERTATTIVMTMLTVVMFGVSATYFALDVSLDSDGILNPKKHPRTVIDLFGPETTAQIILQGINSILGDSIVIWRAWVVWGRRVYVVVVPLVLLVGVAISSFGLAYAQVRAGYDPYYAAALQKYMIALPSITLATNVSATLLVLSRVVALQLSLRRAERHDRFAPLVGAGGVRYRRLLKILIESGGMYCLTWLILLCLVLKGSTAQHVFFSIIGQLTGIYPTLIIVLVSLNMTQERVKGTVVDAGIKFRVSSDPAPRSTFTRTVSFTVDHPGDANGADDGDLETGVRIVSGARCGDDIAKAPNYESNVDLMDYRDGVR